MRTPHVFPRPLSHSSCFPSLSEGMKTPASCMELDAKKPMMLHLIPRPNGMKKGANQQLSITVFHCTVSLPPGQQCNIFSVIIALYPFSINNPASFLLLLLTADTNTISEVGTARKTFTPVHVPFRFEDEAKLSRELPSPLPPSPVMHALPPVSL
jgi:hypothetical protein